MRTYTFINDPKVREIVGLVNQLNKCLVYPYSENSGDERRYTEFFEAKILELIKPKRKTRNIK